MSQKYAWIKLPIDFFSQLEIKLMGSLPDGYHFIVIYLKLLLETINQNGIVYYSGLTESLAVEQALLLDETPEAVGKTLDFLFKNGLFEELKNEEYAYSLVQAKDLIGQNSTSTERVRKYRKKRKLEKEKADILFKVPDSSDSETAAAGQPVLDPGKPIHNDAGVTRFSAWQEEAKADISDANTHETQGETFCNVADKDKEEDIDKDKDLDKDLDKDINKPIGYRNNLVYYCAERKNFSDSAPELERRLQKPQEKIADKNFLVPMKDGLLYRIPGKDIEAFQEACPDVDIVTVLNSLVSWLDEHPVSLSTSGEVKDFIHRWITQGIYKIVNAEDSPKADRSVSGDKQDAILPDGILSPSEGRAYVKPAGAARDSYDSRMAGVTCCPGESTFGRMEPVRGNKASNALPKADNNMPPTDRKPQSYGSAVIPITHNAVEKYPDDVLAEMEDELPFPEWDEELCATEPGTASAGQREDYGSVHRDMMPESLAADNPMHRAQQEGKKALLSEESFRTFSGIPGTVGGHAVNVCHASSAHPAGGFSPSQPEPDVCRPGYGVLDEDVVSQFLALDEEEMPEDWTDEADSSEYLNSSSTTINDCMDDCSASSEEKESTHSCSSRSTDRSARAVKASPAVSGQVDKQKSHGLYTYPLADGSIYQVSPNDMEYFESCYRGKDIDREMERIGKWFEKFNLHLKQGHEIVEFIASWLADGAAGDPEPVFRLQLNDGSLYPIFAEDMAYYGNLYPAANLDTEFRKMIGWIDANPSKRKTSRGIRRFISNWLSKAQDKGGSAGGYHNRTADMLYNSYNMFAEWAKQRDEEESMM